MSFEPEITPPANSKKAVIRKIKWQEDARDWIELGAINTPHTMGEFLKNLFK